MTIEPDWRDGFLFVGNQLSLDFLNTRPMIDGSPVELLPDASALLNWLTAAGLRPAQSWPTKDSAALDRLRTFREEYHDVILSWEVGQPPAPAFLRHVNELLAKHPGVDQIVSAESGLRRERSFPLHRPLDTFGPLMDATADLLTIADPTRIRKCDSCVLHFLDTSKKGTRRWCSMRMCGNRSKVSAYAQRQRADVS